MIQAKSVAKLCRVLAAPSRVKVIRALETYGTLSVGQIAAECGLNPACTSVILRDMERENLITANNGGVYKYCTLNNTDVVYILHMAERLLERPAVN